LSYLDLLAVQSALHCAALHFAALRCTALRCAALPVIEQVQSVLGVTKALPAQVGRAPQAARERLERVACAAFRTAALRHAATQHRGALEVRIAQAGLQLSLCDKPQSAALYAARLGSLVWVGACVPLLKHGHVGVAVQRHAVCQVNQSAPRPILEVVERTAKASVVDYNEYSAGWAACALNALPLLIMKSQRFSHVAGRQRKAPLSSPGLRTGAPGASSCSKGGGASAEALL